MVVVILSFAAGVGIIVFWREILFALGAVVIGLMVLGSVEIVGLLR